MAEATGRERRRLEQSGSDQDRPTQRAASAKTHDERRRPAQTQTRERAYAGARTGIGRLPDPVAAGTGEPRRPGPAAASGVEDPVETAGGRGRERVGLEPAGERSVEVVVAGHAIDSLATVGVRSSASSAARRAAEARFSRDLKVPIGDVEDDRRLGIRQPEVVVDDEHGALLRGQATEASLQLVAHRGQVLGVAVPTPVGRGHVDLDDLALLDPPCLR